MAQPNPYNRAFNFSNWQSSNPTDPLPAQYIDEELSRVKVVLDQVRANLALIQRDDTALANRTVGFDQLKTEIEIGVNPPSPWATATNYIARDTVFHDAKFWLCAESHVSGDFATDEAAGRWEEIASFEAATSATAVAFDNTSTDLDATTVQAALEELYEEITGFSSGVASFNGRTGIVAPASGDYDASGVTFTSAGLANTDAEDVQEAIEDIDTALSGKASSSHTHPQSAITNLVSDLTAKVPTSRQIVGAGLATGGGDLTTSRTITVAKASKSQAEAGTSDSVAMTPLRTKDAITAALAAMPEALSGLASIKAYANSATFVPTSGATRGLVFCTGGGGGNSASSNTSGGAGGTAIRMFDITGNVAVTVGGGGTDGDVGGAGGTSSFGAVCSATGGSGGNINEGAGGVGFGGLGIVGGTGGASFWGGPGAYGSQGTGGLVFVMEFY